MTRLVDYRSKRVGVAGLARSGLAAVRALRAAGAEVVAFDDNAAALDAARGLGAAPGGPADVPGLAALLLSPGIPLTHPAPHRLVVAAKSAGVPIVGDIDLFAAEAAPRPIVGITGTNGKSTTTALTHHLLRAAGRPALLGGNIGRAVLDLELGSADETVVLELSSFQLDLCTDLRCRVAAWLNLTPDHLDRHGGLEGYVAAKERIFRNQGDGDHAVVGIDDAPSRAVADELTARGRSVIRVSVDSVPAGGVGVREGRLVDATAGVEASVVDLGALKNLRGTHNHQNVAVAFAILRALGVPAAAAVEGLASFVGLPHRMELVGREGRVIFVNDSKATNPDAASKSLQSYERIYWIAGGRAGPGGFASLADKLDRVATGFLIGEATEEIETDLAGRVAFRRCGTLEQALAEARAEAGRDGAAEAAVLLAPACKSFDQFKSYEHRGDVFRTLVKTMLGSATP